MASSGQRSRHARTDGASLAGAGIHGRLSNLMSRRALGPTSARQGRPGSRLSGGVV